MALKPDDLGLLKPNSDAPWKVRFNINGERYYTRYKNLAGESAEVQVTVKSAGFNAELAERVAQLCYDRLEEGLSKPEVVTFRDELLERCREAAGEGTSTSRKTAKALSPKAAAAPTAEQKADKSAKKSADKAAKRKAEELEQDDKEEAAKKAAEIAAATSADSEDAAAMAIRLAAEAAQAAVLAALEVQQALTQDPKTDKPDPVDQVPVAEEERKEEQQEQQAPEEQNATKRIRGTRIEGRALDKPNAVINGFYSAGNKKVMFHGRRTWEKVTDKKDERLVLFYSSPNFQWKLCTRFDDKAPVVAFAPVEDRGHSPPSGPGVKWYVSDGKDFTPDPQVRFVFDDEGPGEERSEKKRRKGDATEEQELSELEVARRNMQTCEELAACAAQLRDEGKLNTALLMQGRADSKKKHRINGIYIMRGGKFHGAVSYMKLTFSDKVAENKRFLIYSATQHCWKIVDKLQDQDSFAFAKVEDRGLSEPADLPPGYLVWKVFEGREAGGYVKDGEITCCRLNVEALQAASGKARREYEALQKEKEKQEQPQPSPLQASDARVAATIAAVRAETSTRVQREAPPKTPDAEEILLSSSDSEEAPARGSQGIAGMETKTAASGGAKVIEIQDDVPDRQRPAAPVAKAGAKESAAEATRQRKQPAAAVPIPAVPTPAVNLRPAVKVLVTSIKGSSKLSLPSSKGPALPKAKGKACAKMLVRGGLRCSCCFRIHSECRSRAD
eukprot:TRINITY_DN62223_c0_g1_i1.p1 TRINITY_DN62223_c0_g1~~TRINITY_DN62223_c0_g1_i1.p1  ORF type:complete len:730 (-),score=199.13 TRINITY_DN62223_c0_g1_i1:72-2261(-)